VLFNIISHFEPCQSAREPFNVAECIDLPSSSK